MRIGMIGLGSIARKAYLPVIVARPGLDLFLATRNQQVLKEIGDAYRVAPERQFADVEGLIAQQLDAVFVHVATEAHAAIVERLLQSGVHVYVDKPIDYQFGETKRLLTLASESGRVLMTGFNRRYAPLYRAVKEKADPTLIVMQKNRKDAAEDVRTAILDDFIHVVDTLLYMAPEPATDLSVSWQMESGLLTQVAIRLSSYNCTSVGIMHRNSGSDEEVLEVTGHGHKWRVVDLRESIAMHEGEAHSRPGNWTSVGVVRGFSGTVEHFLDSVQKAEEKRLSFDSFDVLRTHQVCEEIVQTIESASRDKPL